MEWGGKLEFLNKLRDSGQKVKALEDRPTLDLWSARYYEAFMVLSPSRTIHMGGVGHIPLSEIQAYCYLYAVEDLDEVDDLVMMIRALDSEYLKLMDERQKRKTASADVAGSTVPTRPPPRGRMGRMGRR